ncbi:hypothetical protein NpNSSI1_00011839 [Neofusicoccum parvum]|nr:hypothetical protein NpNSSI1_00011839 [Neofusicoccum parvum]
MSTAPTNATPNTAHPETQAARLPLPLLVRIDATSSSVAPLPSSPSLSPTPPSTRPATGLATSAPPAARTLATSAVQPSPLSSATSS